MMFPTVTQHFSRSVVTRSMLCMNELNVDGCDRWLFLCLLGVVRAKIQNDGQSCTGTCTGTSYAPWEL